VAEFDQDHANADEKDADGATAQTAVKTLFVMIKSLPRIAHGRDLRLREGDIIVAIDGELNELDIDAFRGLCEQAKEDAEPLLLTICRGDVIYDVLVEGRLGAELEYANAEASVAAQTLLSKHHIGPKDHYRNYEALRDIRRHVVLYDTAYSAIATLAPPIWLLQHRAWEPMAAVIAAYATSAVVHWGVFVATAILMAIYFHRIQFRLIRNYSLFTEHYFWHVCAARSAAEAQLVCRQLDPYCYFDFSHVGPPAVAKNEQQPRQKKQNAAEPA
jgi:hypothetical protein